MKHFSTAWFRQQRQLLAEHGVLARLKALAKKILRPFFRRLKTLLDHHPRTRQLLIRCLDRMGIRHRVNRIQSPPAAQNPVLLDTRGQEIRNDLKRTLAKLEEI
jgi:hypothetical protein